jgi:hypothetical protein
MGLHVYVSDFYLSQSYKHFFHRCYDIFYEYSILTIFTYLQTKKKPHLWL